MKAVIPLREAWERDSDRSPQAIPKPLLPIGEKAIWRVR